MIIDTHMHLFDKKYDGIRNDVIEESLQMNIKKMIAVGYDYKSSLEAIKLSKEYSFIYVAIGLHPSEVQKENDKELKWIYDLAKESKVVAIGEIGLDYYWDKSYKELQKELFKKQIEIANKLDLPIIIHCRDAIQDTFDLLKSNLKQDKCLKGVLHCYSGSVEMAKEFIKLGYYLGIGGVLTFKNSKELKKVVEEISLDKLLTETDSPYLAPTPHRGEINKPAYIPLIIDEIANIKNEKKEIIENIMYNNAITLFPKIK